MNLLLKKIACCSCCNGKYNNCKCALIEGLPAPFDAVAIGEVLMTFSGASVPSTVTTPDYRNAIFDLMGNPGDPGVGHAQRNKIYTATDRTTFDIFGEMPETIRGWCSHPNSSVGEGCLGRDPQRTLHFINDRTATTPSGPSLPYLSFIACAFPQWNTDRRRNYRGEEIPFPTEAESWPFMLPYADGYDMSQGDVNFQAQLIYGGFGGDPNEISFALMGTVDGGWNGNVIYTDTTDIGFDCEHHATRMNYSFVAWRGSLTLDEGETFPCSRDEWVFDSVGSVGDQNWITAGEDTTLPGGTCVQIGSGGTMTLTSANCRRWLGDAPEIYRVDFTMGPPGFIDGSNNPTTVTTTGVESTTIDLIRYCSGTISSAGEVVGNWYGESTDYKASMWAIDEKSAGLGSTAFLKIERKTNFPSGAGPFHCVLIAQITNEERSPPEHDETTPRYILDANGFSHYRWLGCDDQFSACPSCDNAPIQQFTYRLESVTKEGDQPFTCPRMRCYVGCPEALKVVYLPTSGSETSLDSIQVMLVSDTTPDGYTEIIVYPNPTTEDNGVCRWDSEPTTPYCQIQYFNVSEDFIKRTVTPPHYEISISQACPNCIFTVTANVETDNHCVPLGEWIIDDIYCADCASCSVAPCGTCDNFDCTPSSVSIEAFCYGLDEEMEPIYTYYFVGNLTRINTTPGLYSGTIANTGTEGGSGDFTLQVVDGQLELEAKITGDGETIFKAQRDCSSLFGGYSLDSGANNFCESPNEHSIGVS